MKFHLADDDTFRLSELHPLELRFLKQAPLMADPQGSPEARSRLFPDPLKRHRSRKGEKAEKNSDWEEYVVPGLEKRFQSAVQVVDRDLEQVDFEDGWNVEFDEIIIPIQHAEQWYLALNQARLVMAERFQLHAPPRDALPIPDDHDDDEQDEDTASSPGSASLNEDPPRPKIAILTFIQYEFYGRLQCYLMDLFL